MPVAKRIDLLVALNFLTPIPEAVDIPGAAWRKCALNIAIARAGTAICNVRVGNPAGFSGSDAYIGKKGVQEHIALYWDVAEGGNGLW